MTKILKSYVVVWAICFALFSAIVFLSPIEHSNGFWVGYPGVAYTVPSMHSSPVYSITQSVIW